jgi:hypothetical protein
MQSEPTPKKRQDNNGCFSLWLVISFLLFMVLACPRFYPRASGVQIGYDGVRYNEIVDYSRLLAERPILRPLLSNPFLILIVVTLVGFWLIWRGKVGRVRLLLPLMVPLACSLYILEPVAGVFRYAFQHLETEVFDGNTYHLSMRYTVQSGMFASPTIHLFECLPPTADTQCRGRELRYGRITQLQDYFIPTALNVDATRNQLNVLFDEQVIATFDARTVPNDLPQNLELITHTNVSQLQELLHLQYDSLRDLAWSSDRAILAAGGSRALWAHRFEANTISTESFPSAPSIITFRPGETLVMSDGLGLLPWTLTSQEPERLLDTSNTGPIAYSPSGRLLAIGRDGDVLLLDGDTFETAFRLTHDEDYLIRGYTFSSDGLLLAASGVTRDRRHPDSHSFVHVWNLRNGEEVFLYRTEATNRISPVAFAPNSTHLAFSITDESAPAFNDTYLQGDAYLDCAQDECQTDLYVWDVAANEEVFAVPVPAAIAGNITDIEWTPQGDGLITVKHNGAAQFWNADDGSLIYAILGDAYAFRAVALSPDGRTLALSASDGVRLFGIPSE